VQSLPIVIVIVMVMVIMMMMQRVVVVVVVAVVQGLCLLAVGAGKIVGCAHSCSESPCYIYTSRHYIFFSVDRCIAISQVFRAFLMISVTMDGFFVTFKNVMNHKQIDTTQA
jgi:hypothetical protein